MVNNETSQEIKQLLRFITQIPSLKFPLNAPPTRPNPPPSLSTLTFFFFFFAERLNGTSRAFFLQTNRYEDEDVTLKIFLAMTAVLQTKKPIYTTIPGDKRKRHKIKRFNSKWLIKRNANRGRKEANELDVKHHTKPGCKVIGGLDYSTAVVIFLR